MNKLRNAGFNAYSVASNSWGGRILFVGHLLFMIVVLRHYEMSLLPLPVLAFILLNLPQLTILRLIAGPLNMTGWIWALLGLFISIPWWAYGIAAEFAIRRVLFSNYRYRQNRVTAT